MKYNGTGWVKAGDEIFVSDHAGKWIELSLSSKDTLYLAYHWQDADEKVGKMSLKKLNGSTWEDVGTSLDTYKAVYN